MNFFDAKLIDWEVGVPPEVSQVPAQLSLGCRSAYYLAAKHFYTGEGVLIDSGTLAGGTSVALLVGAKEASIKQIRRPMLHAFDLFLCDWATPTFFKYYFGGDWKSGDSFLPIYLKSIEKYADDVVVHSGDLIKFERWSGEAIQVYGVDVWKTLELAEHSVYLFFSSLEVGCIVIQQDYKTVWLPWIHTIMEAFSDYFQKIHEVPGVGGTVVFQVIRRIPKEAIPECLARHSDYTTSTALIESAKTKASSLETRVFIEFANVIRETRSRGKVAGLECLSGIVLPELGSDLELFFKERRIEIDRFVSHQP